MMLNLVHLAKICIKCLRIINKIVKNNLIIWKKLKNLLKNIL